MNFSRLTYRFKGRKAEPNKVLVETKSRFEAWVDQVKKKLDKEVAKLEKQKSELRQDVSDSQFKKQKNTILADSILQTARDAADIIIGDVDATRHETLLDVEATRQEALALRQEVELQRDAYTTRFAQLDRREAQIADDRGRVNNRIKELSHIQGLADATTKDKKVAEQRLAEAMAVESRLGDIREHVEKVLEDNTRVLRQIKQAPYYAKKTRR